MLPRCCSLASSHCHAEHDHRQSPRKNLRMLLIDIGCAVVESQFFSLAQPLCDKVPFAMICLKTHKVRYRNAPLEWFFVAGRSGSERWVRNEQGEHWPIHFSGPASLQKPRPQRILTKICYPQVLISQYLRVGNELDVTTVTYTLKQDRLRFSQLQRTSVRPFVRL